MLGTSIEKTKNNNMKYFILEAVELFGKPVSKKVIVPETSVANIILISATDDMMYTGIFDYFERQLQIRFNRTTGIQIVYLKKGGIRFTLEKYGVGEFPQVPVSHAGQYVNYITDNSKGVAEVYIKNSIDKGRSYVCNETTEEIADDLLTQEQDERDELIDLIQGLVDTSIDADNILDATAISTAIATDNTNDEAFAEAQSLAFDVIVDNPLPFVYKATHNFALALPDVEKVEVSVFDKTTGQYLDEADFALSNFTTADVDVSISNTPTIAGQHIIFVKKI